MALQRYSVVERLDAGGMAEVFKGKSTSIQGIEKLVAIKRILPALTKHKKFISMFLDEARLSMNLNHANIVQVFDLGVADNTYFIVMEYVDGPNLKVITEATRRTGYRIPAHRSIYIMMEVCKALTHAHTKKDANGVPLGIVHRDISPPNILLSREGEVKLTDFGLAKAQSQLENTEPGVVKGKFSYLSPEAAYGEEVDHRSDLFAVGIILWEMLAGQRLFLGATDLETLELVRRCVVPSLPALNPEVTPELERIVLRALARRVEDRYGSAQELGDDLAHYIFARNLKVTNYDISLLVELVLSGKLGEAPRQSVPLTLIDRLIQGELETFRSIDSGSTSGRALGSDPSFYDGSRPLALSDLSGNLGGSLSLSPPGAPPPSTAPPGRSDPAIPAAAALRRPGAGRREASGASRPQLELVTPASAGGRSAERGAAAPGPAAGDNHALAVADGPLAEAAPATPPTPRPASAARWISTVVVLLLLLALAGGAGWYYLAHG